MTKFLITTILIILTANCSFKPNEYRTEIKDGVYGAKHNNRSLIIGRIRVYTDEEENDLRGIVSEIGHKCRVTFKTDKKYNIKRDISAKIAKHGLFTLNLESELKNLEIDYISCAWNKKKYVNFIDLNIKLKNIDSDKLNYIEDISLFFQPDKKPLRAFESCSNSSSCKQVFIFPLRKIIKEDNSIKTYSDINAISPLPFTKNQISKITITQSIEAKVRIIDEKNINAF